MIILHGVWETEAHQPPKGSLFLWGETSEQEAAPTSTGRVKGKPRRKTGSRPHPFQASLDELTTLLAGFRRLMSRRPEADRTLLLPSARHEPLPSLAWLRETGNQVKQPELRPWTVHGLRLSAADVLQLPALLDEMERSGEWRLGYDARLWLNVAELALELLAQHRFCPWFCRDEKGRFHAVWHPVLDRTDDQKRLAELAKALPDACRCIVSNGSNSVQRVEPRAFVLHFLSSVCDAAVRELLVGRHEIEANWLRTLVSKDSLVEGSDARLRLLEREWKLWSEPLRVPTGATAFRTCFQLNPPEEKSEKAEPVVPKGRQWRLNFLLQATDDPSLLVPADQVWTSSARQMKFLKKRFENPQERLLADLGRASRMMPALERSLKSARPETCELNTTEAYSFLREAAPLLEECGFGVLVPSWWDRQTGATGAMGIRMKLAPTKDKGRVAGHGLTLSSIIEFDWEVALGDQRVSREEFERLAAMKVPLVHIRGQWVELNTELIEKAIRFLESKERDGELSLREAIGLALGRDSDAVGIPVVDLEAKGWIKEFLTSLRDHEKIELLPPPKDLRGTLRPYQQRGVSWLSFLHRWDLGACLADDMGTGKCQSADSLIVVNGMLQKAEDVWNHYVAEAIFDGEGYWAEPPERLVTNSIDGKTGEIVLTQIRRLYRQRIHQRLRTIKLEDGSGITITRQHKLLTDRGWTNDLHTGDYVCVPAKIVWDGKPEDPDLVEFLAWQIAEGYEIRDRGTVTLTQKDASVLKRLLECLHRFGGTYGIKINCPAIHFPSNHKSAYLTLNSAEYRRFLEARGYEWGKLSRGKSIPPFIMQADLESVRLFLSNYFSAEASVVSSMRSIEISTASPLLIQQLSYLLRRFGIWLRISAKQKCATNGTRILRTYYIGTMGGNAARKFCQQIGFSDPGKQKRLENICEQKNNTNVEGIPASDIMAQTVAATGLPVRHLGMKTVYIYGTQQFSRTSLEQVVSAVRSILSGEAEQQYRTLKPSKWTNQTLNAYANLDKRYLFETREHLQHLLDQEVYYCRIKGIEEIEYDGWVYDFEVEEHHNFVANNILCHNTVQFLALLLHEKAEGRLDGPSLVVCPTSVIGNWQREARRFAPSLKVMVHHGTERMSSEKFAAEAAANDLVVTSYSLTHRDAKTLSAVEWACVALDEAQNIKNPETKQAQTIRKLKAERRVALTGTPVENRLSELWSIMDFLNKGYLGSLAEFKRAFAIPIERYRETSRAEKLKTMVQPFILRRLKTDPRIIQDLPEKIEMKVYCPLTREQATLYQAVVEDMLQQINDAEGIKRKGAVLAALMKLKQVCNHPAQFLKDGSALENRSGKLTRLVEMLDEALAEGDRMLIFTQFAEMGELLKQHLQNQFGCEALFLHGGVPRKAREKMIDRFQSETGPPLFVLSLKAGGLGLNLTRANRVFHFDRWWNPAVEEQATDRAFRIGQTRNVHVHKYVCTGTLEEKIDAMIESKRELARLTIGTGEGWITELSTDQLRDLFELRKEAIEDERL